MFTSWIIKINQLIINILHSVMVPSIAMVIFLVIWHLSVAHIDTSLGKMPNPSAVWQQFTHVV
jgi:ABC-type nitrate/sulfonate/bicarbonate transport system permease component